MSLGTIQRRLLQLCPDAAFDPPAYLESWLNPAAAELFLQYAIEHPQDQMQVQKIEAPPSKCHETALKYCTEHPELVAWFGLVLLKEDGVWRFWLHSRATDQALTARFENDPTASHSTRFVGVPWPLIYPAITKRPGAPALRDEELPECLRASRFDKSLTTKGDRTWANGL